jgi:hypothetical protein
MDATDGPITPNANARTGLNEVLASPVREAKPMGDPDRLCLLTVRGLALAIMPILALAFPALSQATALRPVALTSNAQATGGTTAEVDGTVNPEAQSTTYHAAYGLSSSTWCEDNGALGSPTSSTTAEPLPYSDSIAHVVAVNLSSLAPGYRYCVEIVATNVYGSTSLTDGGQTSFEAGAGFIPTAFTESTSASGATTATMHGGVNPQGQSTTYHAAYGLATSTWCATNGAIGSPPSSTAPQPLMYTDSTGHSVTVNLAELTPGDEYCAELVATNASGSTNVNDGAQTSFTGGILPFATTSGAITTAVTTARVEGEVNPEGQSTAYYAAYGLASSTWCASNGASGSPSSSTTPQALPFTDSGYHSVAVNVAGLTPGDSYCAAVAAADTSGTSYGSQVSFRPGLPPEVTTINAQSITDTTAEVAGTVNPEGQATSYYVRYGTSGSSWCSGHGGSPTNATAPQVLPFTDLGAHAVIVSLNGLTPGGAYCAELVAQNSNGASPGEEVQFSEIGAPPPVLASLSVFLSGDGSGTVTGSGVNCPNDASCSSGYSYNYDASVSLVATAHPGSTFTGWSGACSGKGVCTMTMNSNETVTARFTSNLITPANVGRPTIRGRARNKGTLTASAGAWTGTTPITYRYQWEACNAKGKKCKAIRGATKFTLKLGPSNLGHCLEVVVTAVNAVGRASAASKATPGVKK